MILPVTQTELTTWLENKTTKVFLANIELGKKVLLDEMRGLHNRPLDAGRIGLVAMGVSTQLALAESILNISAGNEDAEEGEQNA